MTSALPFPLPHCGCPNKPSRTHSGAANGRESIIALSGCKGVLAQQRFTATKFSIDALTSFSLLSNIRPVYWGSSGMVRTSRCFKMTSQFARPEALSIARRFRCSLLRNISVRPTFRFFTFSSNSNFTINPSGHGLFSHGREAGAVFSASA